MGFGTPGEINSTFITAFNDLDLTVAKNYSLMQNYPNPFNPNTVIRYSIPNKDKWRADLVNLKIFDLLGREIKTLVNEIQSAGNYEIAFDAKDLTSGIYFYQLTAGEFKTTKKDDFT